MSDDLDKNSLETPADAGKGKVGVVRRWISEIKAAQKVEQRWREKARYAIDSYTSRRDDEDEIAFNAIYANTIITEASLLQRPPRADCRRRYRAKDAPAKIAAEALQRCLQFVLDSEDFELHLRSAVHDRSLIGRGITRIWLDDAAETPDLGLESGYSGMQGGVPAPQLGVPVAQGFLPSPNVEIGGGVVNQTAGDPGRALKDVAQDVLPEISDPPRIWFEHIPYDRVVLSPATCWYDVRWVAFVHFFTRDEVEDLFGAAAAEKVKYTSHANGDFSEEQKPQNAENEHADVFMRALVYEVWDRDQQRKIYVADGVNDGPLLEEESNMRLRGFLPMPRPLYGVQHTTSLMPVCDYQAYEAIMREVDLLTRRIRNTTSALRVRGIADGRLAELGELLEESNDNEIILCDEVQSVLAMQSGGLDKAIWLMPIDKLIAVLKTLMDAREAAKAVMFEIGGIADIMRGATDPRETLGAQEIKSQFGSLRIDRARRDVQYYARDLVRLVADLITEHWSPDHIAAVSDMGTEYTMQADQILRNDLHRAINVDIETDSTIAADLATDAQATREFVTAMIEVVNGLGPAVLQGHWSIEAFRGCLGIIARRFNMGAAFEDFIDQLGASEGQSSQQMKQQLEALAAQLKQMQQEAEGVVKERDTLRKRVVDLETDTTVAKAEAEVEVINARKEAELAKAHLSRQGSIVDFLERRFEHMSRVSDMTRDAKAKQVEQGADDGDRPD